MSVFNNLRTSDLVITSIDKLSISQSSSPLNFLWTPRKSVCCINPWVHSLVACASTPASLSREGLKVAPYPFIFHHHTMQSRPVTPPPPQGFFYQCPFSHKLELIRQTLPVGIPSSPPLFRLLFFFSYGSLSVAVLLPFPFHPNSSALLFPLTETCVSVSVYQFVRFLSPLFFPTCAGVVVVFCRRYPYSNVTRGVSCVLYTGTRSSFGVRSRYVP